MGKGGGGSGRSGGREQGASSQPYPDSPNDFVDSLPADKEDYVEIDLTPRKGEILISIFGDKQSDPNNGAGYYSIEHSGISINENMKGAVFLKPSQAAIRKEKDELIDREYSLRQSAKTGNVSGSLLNSADRIKARIEKIISYEKAAKKTVSKALASNLEGAVKAYIHKSKLSEFKDKTRYRKTGQQQEPDQD